MGGEADSAGAGGVYYSHTEPAPPGQHEGHTRHLQFAVSARPAAHGIQPAHRGAPACWRQKPAALALTKAERVAFRACTAGRGQTKCPSNISVRGGAGFHENGGEVFQNATAGQEVFPGWWHCARLERIHAQRGIPQGEADLDPRTTTLGKFPKKPFFTAVGGNKSTVLENDRFDVMHEKGFVAKH